MHRVGSISGGVAVYHKVGKKLEVLKGSCREVPRTLTKIGPPAIQFRDFISFHFAESIASHYTRVKMRLLQAITTGVLIFSLGVSAQFNFFEQMFHGAGQQQQPPQNAPSDAEWYRKQYDGGMAP
jgi:hypothetical protein